MQRPPLDELVARRIAPVAEKLDRAVGWDRLPPKLGVLALLGIRQRLRMRNLYDLGDEPAPQHDPTRGPAPVSPNRSEDGSGTDPEIPWMGAAGTRFSRNTAPAPEDDEVRDSPSPATVSERLLTRTTFFPAEQLNLLAAAWVQFEVHDWFSHQTDDDDPAYLRQQRSVRDEDEPTQLPPLRRDRRSTGHYAPCLSNQTHWWDASQLYGASAQFSDAIRQRDGRGWVKVDGDLLEALRPFTGGPTAAVPNLWIGTALFHILFAKEHNAICDRLRDEHPGWDDDRLYAQARLINAAVMAKIHTVEWTPAIVAHPTTVTGLRATWWGLLGPDWRKRLGGYHAGEALSGIPGSRSINHDGAGYALTEEFVAVYRMHQLIPDDVTFRRLGKKSPTGRPCPFEALLITSRMDADARAALHDRWLADRSQAHTIYSLATAPPGQITLHNLASFLQNLPRQDGPGTLDLGSEDIRRTREAGVPRYNNFRRLFRLAPAADFHELANGNPQWAQEIRDVYGGRIEDVDLLVGLFAERKPRGFAFSDTAFRVFLLMAARRLRSDRFFTTDYTVETYTAAGMRWIANATLSGVLRRHHPELSDALRHVENPFRAWPH
jgi:hypothetical protein